MTAAGGDSMHLSKLLLVGVAVVASRSAAPAGTAGLLDPTFGAGGRAFTTFAGGSASTNAMALMPDGKVVLDADIRSRRILTLNGLVRFAADGSLDAGFGSGGRLLIDCFASGTQHPCLQYLTALAAQPDGMTRDYTAALPLTARVVVDGATAPGDRCMQSTFPGPPPAPACTLDAPLHKLTCL